MNTPSNMHLVDQLCAETERAWIDRRDASVVDRLAGEHPQHASELYEFFSSLIYASSEASVPERLARRAIDCTRDWLQDQGFEGPRSFLQYLQQRTGEDPDAILGKIENVSWEFLAMVSRYPAVVPEKVCEELASRIAAGWNIAREECLGQIKTSGLVPTAASRDTPFPEQPTSFEELLKRSALKKEQHSYWTGLADS